MESFSLSQSVCLSSRQFLVLELLFGAIWSSRRWILGCGGERRVWWSGLSSSCPSLTQKTTLHRHATTVSWLLAQAWLQVSWYYHPIFLSSFVLPSSSLPVFSTQQSTSSCCRATNFYSQRTSATIWELSPWLSCTRRSSPLAIAFGNVEECWVWQEPGVGMKLWSSRWSQRSPGQKSLTIAGCCTTRKCRESSSSKGCQTGTINSYSHYHCHLEIDYRFFCFRVKVASCCRSSGWIALKGFGFLWSEQWTLWNSISPCFRTSPRCQP